jgi:hypothetical protein
MRCNAEVLGRYDHAGDANHLLYAPLPLRLTFRESRRYAVDFDGDEAALHSFLRRVLADATSHELRLGEAPALSGWSFCIDYGMKPGALDLEKETILQYFRSLPQPGFQLNGLRIMRRIYVFGAPVDADVPDLAARFVRDIVNPAIHHHQVHCLPAAATA